MSKCSCDKTACTYPECDDGQLLVPVWQRVHTAAALANLAGEIAKLQERAKALEAQKTTLQTQVLVLSRRFENMQELIDNMEADS